jgi:DNA-binding transcriptional LysR family regulator
MTATLDIATVQAFLLVADLHSFTRTAETLGTTQAAVSLKLQRLEALLGKRLVERSPRAVKLTAEGAAFLPRARALMDAHDRALSGEAQVAQLLSLGISDHAAGPELVRLLERLHAISSQLTLAVSIGFSRQMLEAYDKGQLDAVIVRQEGSRRGGEKLVEDEFGWFASRHFNVPKGEALPLATLAPPCGVRAIAARALDKAGIPWRRPCRGTAGATDRAAWAGRHRPNAQASKTWRVKGDAAFEGQRPHQARRTAHSGGGIPERGGVAAPSILLLLVARTTFGDGPINKATTILITMPRSCLGIRLDNSASRNDTRVQRNSCSQHPRNQPFITKGQVSEDIAPSSRILL